MDEPIRIEVEPFDISCFLEPEEIILVTVTPDPESAIPEIGQGCRDLEILLGCSQLTKIDREEG